jgi:hypothetical protein
MTLAALLDAAVVNVQVLKPRVIRERKTVLSKAPIEEGAKKIEWVSLVVGVHQGTLAHLIAMAPLVVIGFPERDSFNNDSQPINARISDEIPAVPIWLKERERS